MSITDMTGSLELSWQEIDAVSFTAGTLADEDACVSQVEKKLQRGTLSTSTEPSTTDVKAYLVRAKEILCETYGYSWVRRFAYATLTSGEHRFALPPDYAGGRISLRDITNNKSMRPCDPDTFMKSFPDIDEYGSTDPGVGVFTIINRELWVSYNVSGSPRIELEYARSGDDNTTSDMTYIPEPMRWRLVDYAIAECFEQLHEYERAQYFGGKWAGQLQIAKKKSGRMKWTHANAQARSWFRGRGSGGTPSFHVKAS